MGKRERHFERVAEFKERFRPLPMETIRRRLNLGGLLKEAAIALRELLEESEVGEGPREGETVEG